MANSSSYKVLLEAQIDPSKINQQIKVIQAQNTLLLNVKFNQNDLSVLNAQLDKLKQAGAELSKVIIFGDSSGGIRKAAVEYLDTNKNIVKTTMDINKGIKITQSTMQNLTQYAKEFSTSLLNAEKFLEKSKNMAATPQVQAAVTTANAIKEAVSAGDIAKVRELNSQLAVQKSALTANKSALDSWIGGMKNAIKQTIEYAISVGLIYGALRQLKEGIQFVADLNKEMVKIQVLQVEGAKTAEQIGSLALSFNSLARELGSTTQEIAKGSVEWFFNRDHVKLF